MSCANSWSRAIAVAVLFASAARAHTPPRPVRGALELSPGGVALMLIVDVFQGPAAAQLRLEADRDHDGVLSANERAALAEALAERALAGFAARLDGAPLTFAPRERKADALDWSARTDAALAVSVWLQSAGKPAPGRHELVLARGVARVDAAMDLIVQGAGGAKVVSVRGARRSAIPGSGPSWRLAAGKAATIVFEVP